MAPFSKLNVEETLEQLTTAEKTGLISGIDFWHTFPVPRLGIPSLRFSDGPNGVRGTRFFNGIPAACFPCGTGLGATFDVELLEEVGRMMGKEAKAKGAHVILGPTINMQRSPLGGRGFESFSEDPVLAGFAAAAVINGIQTTGVVATIKHYVGNDQEHDRMAVNSIVTDRAMREIYLKPFQLAIRDSTPKALMTAYNKVNGTHVSESSFYLDDVLRKEWGFEGLIMSDWYGVYSTSESVNAGLDIDMPGATSFRGPLIGRAIGARKIKPSTLDARVRKVLELVNACTESGVEENAHEGTNDTPETTALLRKVAAESVVLLKNDSGILPLSKTKTTAVIGPNAKVATFCGGGSASLLPYNAVTPFEGIAAKLATPPTYAEGCTAFKTTPVIGAYTTSPSGKPGLQMKFYIEPETVTDREEIDCMDLQNANIMLMDYANEKILPNSPYYAVITAHFVPEVSSEYEFGVSVFGTAKLYIDDKLVVDNATNQRAGDSFFGSGSAEERGSVFLNAGQEYVIKVTFGSGITSKLMENATLLLGGGLRVGIVQKYSIEDGIASAVAAAKAADQVVLSIGLNNDWESEGYDRYNMDLPGATNQLVEAVLAANSNTVIILQSGTPVEMPWIEKSKALMHAWYGGNETGNGIADVLFGDFNPSGKLPLTFPIKVEDNPAFLNFRSENGRVLYGEDVYIGYRYYEFARKNVLFPFGYGLSYSTFSVSEPSFTIADAAAKPTSAADLGTLTLTATVTNTSGPAGAEVVQLYVSESSPIVNRPVKELKGFARVYLEPGESKTVTVSVSVKEATAYWDEVEDAWIAQKDTYTVSVGVASSTVEKVGEFEVAKTLHWKGL
ncbi:putative beta-glucosidase [Myxozyma melibiosi]|uniref:beta-glucosidase n=1 Tax=Myxozyma melibiosi TaxID=54550 RepID=A0ABR1F1X8_9ASCO